MKKKNLGLLFGGRSCEHEISVTSARSILAAIDRDKYHISLIGIDKSGHWRIADNFAQLLSGNVVKPLASPTDSMPGDAHSNSPMITLALHQHGNLSAMHNSACNNRSPSQPLPEIDVIFPALHGTFGEDGTLQGVFEMAGIPYVGCGVAASALAMDKILAKKIFAAAHIPQAAYLDFTATQWQHDGTAILARGEAQLPYPMFVKPANLGSSVGISKVHTRAGLQSAIELALSFDNKIVLEQSMENCIEAECAVLGNATLGKQQTQASVVGEIIPGAEFYDYATKYLDDKSELVVPANIPEQVAERVRELSIAAFHEIDGAGLARVDFFVHRETWQVTLNEINTMPGFTPISMYPRLWAASGLPYAELIDRLIELSIEAHQAKSALLRTFQPPPSRC